MSIRWNTDVNAPCCPGEIVDEETGETILVQTDCDYPGVASSFSWSIQRVQKCPACGAVQDIGACDDVCNCKSDAMECRCETFRACEHDGTDGTVDCPECDLTVGDFICAAREWLSGATGATAEDPGYFCHA